MAVDSKRMLLWSINWGVIQTAAGEIRTSLPVTGATWTAIHTQETIHGGGLANYGFLSIKGSLAINCRVTTALKIRVQNVTTATTIWNVVSIPVLTNTRNPWTTRTLEPIPFSAADGRIELQYQLVTGYTALFLCAALQVSE